MVVLVAGGCLVQLDRFHPKTWLASARESGATIVHYLGVMPAMLLAAPPSAADRDHAIRWGFGAGVDRKNHAPFEERFGFPLVEAWAMTETGAAACIMANREPRLVGTSCFGRQEDFVQIRLAGEDGGDVATDMPGELLVRSAGDDPKRYFFSGYLKDEEATREAWADGWFHTGDLVRRDAEGNFFFVDRKKNVIRRSGENISAVEVESVLNQHPAVKTSAVAATPDAVRGDEVLACIVMREDSDASQREQIAASIVQHALAQLAYYKAPGYVAFVDALPLTPSQKIQRGQLRELAQSLPGQGHCIDTRSMKKRQA
jgi:acyl-coenzyme A synthetase/AMP-(fatty) acid ligase